jgi:hypothetical protein
MIGKINLDRERIQFRVVGEKPSTKWKRISPSLPHDFNYPLLKKAHNKGGYTKLGTEKVLYPDVAGPTDKVLLFLDDANAKAPCSNLLGAVQLIKFSLEVVSCTGYIHQAMRNECHPQFTTGTRLDISGCSWTLI